jgi:hypothetical protein
MENKLPLFKISKSLSNYYTVTINKQGTNEPMVLDSGDTFVGHLFKLDTDIKDDVVGINISKRLPFEEGKINIEVTDTGHLISERGTKADRYYLKPTYRMVIECDTANNGKFSVRVDNVYVEA